MTRAALLIGAVPAGKCGADATAR